MTSDDRPRTPATPSIPAGRRVYAIGDIHGRLDLFDQLNGMIELDNAERPAAETEVILLGDLIDRDPDSAGVITRPMTGTVGFTPLSTLMGNLVEEILAERMSTRLKSRHK